MRSGLIFIMNILLNEYSIENSAVSHLMTLTLFKEDKIQWNGYLVSCFALLFSITYLYYRRDELKEIKNSLKLIHKQYLYQSLLPSDLYKISDLNCLNIKINHLLFSHKGIYLIQSFNLKGQLTGNLKDWMLEIHQVSSVKTINNPIRILNIKELILKELMELYEVNLPIESYYVYDQQKLHLQLVNELKESKFIKQQEFKSFLEQVLKQKKEKISHENELQNTLYFIISMRYLEYLKGFYYELSLVEKVELSSFLCQDSKQLLSFFVSSSVITIDKIHHFKKVFFNKQSKSLKVLQTKLFDELREWAFVHPTLEFMMFNEEILIFSEGFEFPHCNKSEAYAL